MGALNTPLINGRNYAWADITFSLGGVPVIGITRIDYDEEQVKEDNYGAGFNPVARGYGQRKANASITMYAEEVEALQDNAPAGSLLDYGVFDVTIQYMIGTTIRTHVLKNCEFTRNPRSAATGDTRIEVELPLITSHIIWRK